MACRLLPLVLSLTRRIWRDLKQNIVPYQVPNVIVICRLSIPAALTAHTLGLVCKTINQAPSILTVKYIRAFAIPTPEAGHM